MAKLIFRVFRCGKELQDLNVVSIVLFESLYATCLTVNGNIKI